MLRSGVLSMSSMASRPLVALITSMSWFSSSEVSAKMLRASSSTTSTLRPRRTSLEPCSRSSICLLLRRQVGDDAVQEQRGLVQQPLGRLHVLEHDALGHRLEPRLLLGGQVLAGEDDDGHVGQRRLGVHLLQQLEAGHVGQAQVEHHAVERPARAAPPAPRRRCRRPPSRCRRSRAARRSTARSMSLSSTTSSRLVRGAVKSLMRSKAASRPSVVGALTR